MWKGEGRRATGVGGRGALCRDGCEARGHGEARGNTLVQCACWAARMAGNSGRESMGVAGRRHRCALTLACCMWDCGAHPSSSAVACPAPWPHATTPPSIPDANPTIPAAMMV